MATYSNGRAMRALIKASLQALLKSPSAIFFGLAFPMVFILVFGGLGGSRKFSVSVADMPGADTTNMLYGVLHKVPVLKFMETRDSAEIGNALREGDIVATIGVQPLPEDSPSAFKLAVNVSSSQQDKLPQLQSILNSVLQRMNPEIQAKQDAIAKIDVHVTQIREFKVIDFILPGQLGFSLLAGSVFGTAFVFFNLRQTLVLKRFFATPVRREVIVISEAIARMIFQVFSAIVIISVGHYLFGYTLTNGFATFLELLFMSALGIMAFMGFGFIVSNMAKTDATIPLFANMITLPQLLLAGTFFPIDNFPKWMQFFCRLLPLSYLNDAMRKIGFDGASLWDIRLDVLGLLVWALVLYFIASRVFRWE